MIPSSLFSKANTLNDSLVNQKEEILAQIDQIAPGANAPFELFKLICKTIHFNHAALLFLDSDSMLYFPIVTRNLDRTSALRFTIPESNLPDLLDHRMKIQKYFSYADSKTIFDYHFVNWSSPKQKIFLFFTTTTGKVARELLASSPLDYARESIVKKLATFDKNMLPGEIKRVQPLFMIKANSFIKEMQSRNKSFYFFFVDAIESIERILTNYGSKSFYTYKIENQFYELLNNHFEDFGKITRINYGQFLLVLQIPNIQSPLLIENHLNFDFSNEFNLKKRWKPFKITTTKFFPAICSLEKALNNFLANL